MKLTASQFNRLGIGLILIGAFCTIIYKAIVLPITHDEVATLYLVRDSSFSDVLFYSNQDQNNHILNSILTKLSINIFDIQLWSIRLPNLFFFSFFAIGVWRIVKEIFGFSSFFIIPAAAIFVANPYMLDFFSLCRGYGMSLALTTLSISYLLSLFKHKKIRYTYSMLITACFASYANFTLLYFLAAIISVIIVALFIYRKAFKGEILKTSIGLSLVLTCYTLLIIIPLSIILSTNQMIYWSSDGFLENTLFPLLHNSLSGSKTLFLQSSTAVGIGVILIIIISVFYILKKTIVEKNLLVFSNPIFPSALLLTLTIGINLFHCYVLNAPFLNGRLAVFYHPLFMILFLSFIKTLTPKNLIPIKISLSILTLILTCIHFTQVWKKDNFREWYYDASTYKVINHINAVRNGKQISIDTHWLFNPAFRFHIEFDEIDWLSLRYYNKEILPETNSDYYYIMWDEKQKIEHNFKVAVEYPTGGSLMIKR